MIDYPLNSMFYPPDECFKKLSELYNTVLPPDTIHTILEITGYHFTESVSLAELILIDEEKTFITRPKDSCYIQPDQALFEKNEYSASSTTRRCTEPHIFKLRENHFSRKRTWTWPCINSDMYLMNDNSKKTSINMIDSTIPLYTDDTEDDRHTDKRYNTYRSHELRQCNNISDQPYYHNRNDYLSTSEVMDSPSEYFFFHKKPFNQNPNTYDSGVSNSFPFKNTIITDTLNNHVPMDSFESLDFTQDNHSQMNIHHSNNGTKENQTTNWTYYHTNHRALPLQLLHSPLWYSLSGYPSLNETYNSVYPMPPLCDVPIEYPQKSGKYNNKLSITNNLDKISSWTTNMKLNGGVDGTCNYLTIKKLKFLSWCFTGVDLSILEFSLSACSLHLENTLTLLLHDYLKNLNSILKQSIEKELYRHSIMDISPKMEQKNAPTVSHVTDISSDNNRCILERSFLVCLCHYLSVVYEPLNNQLENDSFKYSESENSSSGLNNIERFIFSYNKKKKTNLIITCKSLKGCTLNWVCEQLIYIFPSLSFDVIQDVVNTHQKDMLKEDQDCAAMTKILELYEKNQIMYNTTNYNYSKKFFLSENTELKKIIITLYNYYFEFGCSIFFEASKSILQLFKTSNKMSPNFTLLIDQPIEQGQPSKSRATSQHEYTKHCVSVPDNNVRRNIILKVITSYFHLPVLHSCHTLPTNLYTNVKESVKAGKNSFFNIQKTLNNFNTVPESSVVNLPDLSLPLEDTPFLQRYSPEERREKCDYFRADYYSLLKRRNVELCNASHASLYGAWRESASSSSKSRILHRAALDAKQHAAKNIFQLHNPSLISVHHTVSGNNSTVCRNGKVLKPNQKKRDGIIDVFAVIDLHLLYTEEALGILCDSLEKLRCYAIKLQATNGLPSSHIKNGNKPYLVHGRGSHSRRKHDLSRLQEAVQFMLETQKVYRWRHGRPGVYLIRVL